MNQRIFHFTLGPVQSFVAQARRTRDLWAGSFLLSWLTGQAMKSVFEQNKTNAITFPAVGTWDEPQDPLLAAILKKGAVTPAIGTIPNRFKAEVDKNFSPDKVVEAVKTAWTELCSTVYEQFIADIAQEYGQNSQEIWTRQIKNFWEINWILGDIPGDGSDDNWLDYRKNWRNHWPEAEGGDHCTLMGDFQEISGYVRSIREQRLNQEKFWQKLQTSLGGLELRDTERLCAIALVKRLFPILKKIQLSDKIGWGPGGSDTNIGNWPSTTYMAVVPWLRHVGAVPEYVDTLRTYAQTILETTGKAWFKVLASEHTSQLKSLEPLRGAGNLVGGKSLDAIDGNLFHLNSLKNHRATYLSRVRSAKVYINSAKDPEEKKRKLLLEELSLVYQLVDKEPRSYYGLLLMDGDHMGKLLRVYNQSSISSALLSFTASVAGIVQSHDGVTIYAGGDDVLALLPLDIAIVCAEELKNSYTKCCADNQLIHPEPTVSGAIIFAHHQLPLQDVVKSAHLFLTEKAKAENGRQSLALGVLKPSGISAEWVNVWDNKISPVVQLQQLIKKMNEGLDYPRGFFHKFQDRYMLLTDTVSSDKLGLDIQKILIAEYMKTVESPVLEQAEKAVSLLLGACSRYRRVQGDDSGGETEIIQCPELQLGGGFIARFLSQEKD